jgi:hypothetical protein
MLWMMRAAGLRPPIGRERLNHWKKMPTERFANAPNVGSR